MCAWLNFRNDYNKAFDSVPHRPLLQKLKTWLSVHPHILRWITHYLCRRSQYVCVNGSSSGVLPGTSGAAQGSVLRPLLFIFYINDITVIPLSDYYVTLIITDDLVLYHPIYSTTDYHLVQNGYWQPLYGLVISYWSLIIENQILKKKAPSLPITPLKIKQFYGEVTLLQVH